MPKRIALQFFVADLDKVADPKAITDAEIDKEYDANKEYYEGEIKKRI